MTRHTRLQIAGGCVLIAAACAATAVAIGQSRWRRQTAALRDRLDHAAALAAIDPARNWRDDLQTLPPPVARYLAKAIKGDQPWIRSIDLVTRGEFRGAADAAWMPFTATQWFSTRPAGFVWDARIRMAPLVPVYVRDAYVDGAGEMTAKVAGAWTVAREVGGAALANGQLMRFLGETIWFPSALLPHQHVLWTPVDDRSAVATIVDRGHGVSLRFTFDAHDDVVEIFAPNRMQAVKGQYVATPWAVHCSDHAWRGHVRVPLRCEAEWRPPTGTFSYWRGTVDDLRFDARQPKVRP